MRRDVERGFGCQLCCLAKFCGVYEAGAGMSTRSAVQSRGHFKDHINMAPPQCTDAAAFGKKSKSFQYVHRRLFCRR